MPEDGRQEFDIATPGKSIISADPPLTWLDMACQAQFPLEFNHFWNYLKMQDLTRGDPSKHAGDIFRAKKPAPKIQMAVTHVKLKGLAQKYIWLKFKQLSIK